MGDQDSYRDMLGYGLSATFNVIEETLSTDDTFIPVTAWPPA